AGHAAGAVHDTEAWLARLASHSTLQPVDPRQRWRLARQAVEQICDRAPGASHADQHTLGVVAHITGQAELARPAPDGRAEADTLYTPSHANFRLLHHRSRSEGKLESRNGKQRMKTMASCPGPTVPAQPKKARCSSAPFAARAASQSDASRRGRRQSPAGHRP